MADLSVEMRDVRGVGSRKIPDNRHSVVITAQADVNGIYELPEVLKESAEKSGGFLRTLIASTTNHLEQARELRMLCQEADIVVLHLFPYDIVPVLALAAGCDPVKTIFVNHADHAFWVGAGVSHVIAHLRKQPPQFSERRRGLNPERCSSFPFPGSCPAIGHPGRSKTCPRLRAETPWSC